MSFVAAAWVIVQGTEAVAAYSGDFFEAYYFRYAGSSTIGNDFGLYELIAFIMYAVWSLSISIWSIMTAMKVWNLVDQRVAESTQGGSGGIIMDPLTAAKFFTLCMIAGFASLVGGFALGDVSDNILTWYDSYAESGKTHSEGSDNDTGKLDPNGTAA